MNPIRYPWSMVITFVIGLVSAPIAVPFVGARLDAAFPPVREWRPLQVYSEGNDLYVSGVVTKARDCRYVPPPRAVTDRGEPLAVVSFAPAAQQNRPAATIPYTFGPWKVLHGAGHVVNFYYEFDCVPFWSTFVSLGTVDGTKSVR